MLERTLILVRCFERLLIVLVGTFIAFLGYRLYALGIDQGEVQLSLANVLLKGSGPGVVFMICGVGLLFHCLRTPIEVTRSHKEDSQGTEEVIRIQGTADPPPSE